MEKNTRIPVLDKGYVELVDFMGDDSYAIKAARMSTGKGFQGWEKDSGLLSYLYENQHMTPFEMSELIIEVKAPIFVFRQWHRHRTQSFNEFSGRYSVMPDEFYVPEAGRVRRQDTKNKQGSAAPFDEVFGGRVAKDLELGQASARRLYNEHIQVGVANELARINLPVSQYSKMWAKGNLRNWLHFESLRLDEHAQWEVRQFAEAVATVIKSLWPRTYALFEEHTLYAETFSHKELAALRTLAEFYGPGLDETLLPLLGEKGVAKFKAKLDLA